MAELPIDVERIVQEVLRELRRALVPASAAVAAENAGHSSHPERSEGPPAATEILRSAQNDTMPVRHTGRLTLAGRVVTLSALDGRLAGIHQLVVAPQAIVTPAVRDELRRRNVALCFAAPPANGSPAAALLLALVVHAGASDAAQLVAALAGEPMVVRQENLDCVIAACERLAGVVADGRSLALLLTRHAAAAICLANRHQGVRAVLATDVAPTAASVAAIGANLLVADPVALGPARLKRIVLDYCRAGARPCPRVFQKELG
jgi:hypothetical protein